MGGSLAASLWFLTPVTFKPPAGTNTRSQRPFWPLLACGSGRVASLLEDCFCISKMGVTTTDLIYFTG